MLLLNISNSNSLFQPRKYLHESFLSKARNIKTGIWMGYRIEK